MKNLIQKTFLIPLLALQLFVFPVPATAQVIVSPGNIIPDCNTAIDQEGHFVEGTECNFGHFILLIRNLIGFVAAYLMAPAIAAAIAYSGFLFLASAANPEKRKEAKGVLGKVILGVFFVLGAWFIVEAVYSGLGYSGFLQFN
jgi:hypothetical protein